MRGRIEDQGRSCSGGDLTGMAPQPVFGIDPPPVGGVGVVGTLGLVGALVVARPRQAASGLVGDVAHRGDDTDIRREGAVTCAARLTMRPHVA